MVRESGEAPKTSPSRMAKEKLFFAWSAASLGKTSEKRPWSAPTTILMGKC